MVLQPFAFSERKINSIQLTLLLSCTTTHNWPFSVNRSVGPVDIASGSWGTPASGRSCKYQRVEYIYEVHNKFFLSMSFLIKCDCKLLCLKWTKNFWERVSLMTVHTLVYIQNTQIKLMSIISSATHNFFLQNSVVNIKIKLHNKVPTIQKHWSSVKRDLRSFLLQHTFYSVEEHILWYMWFIFV